MPLTIAQSRSLTEPQHRSDIFPEIILTGWQSHVVRVPDAQHPVLERHLRQMNVRIAVSSGRGRGLDRRRRS